MELSPCFLCPGFALSTIFAIFWPHTTTRRGLAKCPKVFKLNSIFNVGCAYLEERISYDTVVW